MNAGDGLFGGNWDDRSFLIHTGYGRGVLRDGFLEEVLFREGAHVSLDGAHASAAGWRTAQQADGGFYLRLRAGPPRPRGRGGERLAVLRGPLSVRPPLAAAAGVDQGRDSQSPAVLRRAGLDWTPYVAAMSGPAATGVFEQSTHTATEGGAVAEVVVLLSAGRSRGDDCPEHGSGRGGD